LALKTEFFNRMCATRHGGFEDAVTIEEMEVGPPKPPYRGRL
jgi:hypothetical protein